MKLATYADGSRDGHLVVVADDLAQAHYASHAATRVQQVLDDWNFVSPQLQELAITLHNGRARHAMTFEASLTGAPLKRPPRCVRVGTRPGGGYEACDVPAWFEGARGSWPAGAAAIGAPPAPRASPLQPHWALVTADLPRHAGLLRAGEAVRLWGWAVAWPGGGPWHFAPVLAEWPRHGVPEGSWRIDGLEARPRRHPASGLSAEAAAAAVEAASQVAPLPAGTVVLVPMDDTDACAPVEPIPGAAPRSLRWQRLDAAGGEGCGALAIAVEGAAAAVDPPSAAQDPSSASTPIDAADPPGEDPA